MLILQPRLSTTCWRSGVGRRRRYLEQVGGRAPAVNIHLQTAVQEVSEHGRQPLWVLQLRRPVGGDQVQSLGQSQEEIQDVFIAIM